VIISSKKLSGAYIQLFSKVKNIPGDFCKIKILKKIFVVACILQAFESEHSELGEKLWGMLPCL